MCNFLDEIKLVWLRHFLAKLVSDLVLSLSFISISLYSSLSLCLLPILFCNFGEGALRNENHHYIHLNGDRLLNLKLKLKLLRLCLGSLAPSGSSFSPVRV